MVIAGVAAVALLGACGGPMEESTAGSQETKRQATATRVALAGAAEAAQRYGQAHLGHFLNLEVKSLEAEGLETGEGVSLAVRTKHDSYCIRATNEALASIHPWATGTISSESRVPSIADRCHS